jgi:hypothetical protein
LLPAASVCCIPHSVTHPAAMRTKHDCEIFVIAGLLVCNDDFAF